ncbi:MAG: hypothetical protein NTU57_05015 [Candidatus Aenigmarchaeota archaeon]|nr:hypothetical protein [Candidatus Aenigmarchaeota archaeon]
MTEAHDLESSIIDILRKRPASAETISHITGLPSNSIGMKLRRMEKWRIIRPITKREMLIWSITKD